MFVSVIIPSYNKGKRLYLVLQSLAKQNCGFHNFEVIIVNDGSTDNTSDIVKSVQQTTPLSITHIYQANRGRAAARNTGLKAAKGEIILFLDDDRLVKEDFLKQHLYCFLQRHDENLVVLGKRMSLFFSRFEENFEYYQQLFQDRPEEIYRRAREEHYYWKKVKAAKEMPAISWMLFTTGNVSMGAGLFKKVGTFNEGFKGWGYEDTELGYRLWKQKIPFVVNEAAVNYHIEHLRSRQVLEEDIKRNQVFMQKIHPDFPLAYFQAFNAGDLNLLEFNRLMAVSRL